VCPLEQRTQLTLTARNCCYVCVCVLGTCQVTAGTIFDDVVVTDSLPEAFALAEEGWAKWRGAEKDMYDAHHKQVRLPLLPQ
jgi:hypothetical protein